MNTLIKDSMCFSIEKHINISSTLLQLICFICLINVIAHTSSAYAAVTTLRVSPSNQLIIKDQDTDINLTWQIATDANHSSGITSSNARIINPLTGAVLSTSGGVLSDTGAGPFRFNETISLPARTTDLWFNQGLKNVILKRTFTDPAGGSGNDAQMTLQLSNSRLSASRESTAGDLNVLDLEFRFDNGTVLSQVDQNSHLDGTLTLSYTGTGLLEGRWLIADPAGSYEEPFYRTLALVRKNISANQRTTFKSPILPTSASGKYLLQFCVTLRNTQGNIQGNSALSNTLCPNEDLIVNAAYLVKGSSTKIKRIQGIQPNQQNVSESTVFSWDSLSQTTAYQLQIFELTPAAASLASSQKESYTLQPVFVIGMILEGNTTQTLLSELVRTKLENGKKYLWRISAHNEVGQVLGFSHEATFTYQAESDDLENNHLENTHTTPLHGAKQE